MSFKLTAAQIKSNAEKFFDVIDKLFPEERANLLTNMYKSLGEERLMFAPASGTDHYHNAIPGGYIDHVLRVIKFAKKEYDHYNDLGMDTSTFTKEELFFSALNHDLHKLGFYGEGNDGYLPNPSDWHRKNQGKQYEGNPKVPFMPGPDKALYTLQQFGIRCTLNEYIAIKIHDGLYEEGNKSYYIGYRATSKLRSTLPQILANADMAASRFEFDRWNSNSNAIISNPLPMPNLALNQPAAIINNKPESNLMTQFSENF